MKKLVSFLFIMFMSIALTSCHGALIEEYDYDVLFFTANTGATVVESYYDVEPGELLVQPEDPSRPGFDFEGWYKDLRLTEPWNFQVDVMPEQSIVLYAKWDVTVRQVIYHLNGGTMTSEDYPTEFLPGETFVLPSAKKTGYTFKGWFLYDQVVENYPNSEGTKPGDVGITSIPLTAFEDVNYFAHWGTIKVGLTMKSNHPLGTTVVANPSSRIIAYGTEIDYGVNFPDDYGTVSGYVFLGWNFKKDGTGEWIYDNSIFTKTQPTTLYGQWQPVE